MRPRWKPAHKGQDLDESVGRNSFLWHTPLIFPRPTLPSGMSLLGRAPKVSSSCHPHQSPSGYPLLPSLHLGLQKYVLLFTYGLPSPYSSKTGTACPARGCTPTVRPASGIYNSINSWGVSVWASECVNEEWVSEWVSECAASRWVKTEWTVSEWASEWASGGVKGERGEGSRQAAQTCGFNAYHNYGTLRKNQLHERKENVKTLRLCLALKPTCRPTPDLCYLIILVPSEVWQHFQFWCLANISIFAEVTEGGVLPDLPQWHRWNRRLKLQLRDFWCSHALLAYGVCTRRRASSSTSASPFQDTF